jgi:PKD repeat protein
MHQKIILSFFLLLIFLNTKAQTCVSGGSSNMPTKCFEIESVLADACSSVEGEDEMIRLRIGPNPITLNSINTVVWQTVNSWLGFCSITGATLTKINSINNSIIAAGNCGRFLPISPGGTLPAYSKVLFLTSTDFSATAHDFSGLTDTMYVIMQCAGNIGGHFTNSGNVPRTLVIKTNTCGDTVNWNSANLIGGNGATINFTYAGVPSYVNYGCTLPVVPFSCDAGTTNPTYCNGSTLNLAGTVTGSNCYVWRASNTATGTFADTTNLNTAFTISTGYVGAVKLYLFTKSNCSVKKDSVMFNAIASSGVLNAGRDTSLCNSIAFQVNATSTATGTYSWTKSGAGTLNQTNILNPIYTPSLLDIGIINLIVTQTTSCGVLKDTVKVTYTSKSNANFTLSDSNFCYNNIPLNINLNPTVSGGVFSSNIGSFAANVFTFNSVGSFTVKYKIGTGSCADSLTKGVNSFAHANPNFSLSDTIVCKNAPVVVLTPTQAGGVFSGTRVIANRFTPDTVGIFGLKYKISNGACIDSLSKNIDVKPKPDPFFISSKTTFCLNDASAILTPNTSGGIFSGTNVSGALFTPSTVGVFTVKYKVSNAFCLDSSNQNFTVFNKPNPSFSLSDSLVCIGSPTITLTPTQVGGVFSGTNVSAQIFSPITTGIFPIKYLISNANCADSAYKNIEVKPKPNASFTTTDSVFCVNDAKAIFTPTEAGGVFTGTNVLGNQFNPITVGSFKVKYIINNKACADSSFKTMLVNPKPTANFIFTPANPYTYDTVYFTFTGANATKYYWRFGDSKSSTSNLKDPLFEFTDTNVYKTWLKVTNNEGCSDSIYKDIPVLKRETIFVPNVFTPQNTDGLGLNDYFTIRSYGINIFAYANI